MKERNKKERDTMEKSDTEEGRKEIEREKGREREKIAMLSQSRE